LTIWVEHRASAIVERLLGELSPNPRGRRRGTVMVAAVTGDLHSLPTSMAAVTLRADNWVVEHLGADMPPDELVRFCVEHDVDVAVLSSTNPDVADLAADTAERIRAAGTPVVLGGPGRSLDDLVESVRSVDR
jgi:methylmalonyl-CoA mutase cobalamin-binding subunit